MNKYLKSFFHRGLIFSGLGPVVCAIVFLCLHFSGVDISFNGYDYFLATVSTYVIAFVQGGASIFTQIEHWSVPRSILCHFSSVYAVYTLAYLINSWIPFEPMIIVIYTAVFVALYIIIWLVVFISVKNASKKLNSKL